MSLSKFKNSLEEEFEMVDATESVDGENVEHAITTTDSTMAFVDDPHDDFLSMTRQGGQDIASTQLKIDDNNDNYLIRMSAGPEEDDQCGYYKLEKVGRFADALDMDISAVLDYMSWWFCTDNDSKAPIGCNLVGEGWFLIAPVNIGPEGVSDPDEGETFDGVYADT